jgi:hypothetical protein
LLLRAARDSYGRHPDELEPDQLKYLCEFAALDWAEREIEAEATEKAKHQ